MQHPLELAVDHLAAAVEAEEHSAEMAVWAVAALAHRLDLPIVVGDDALGNAPSSSDEAPRYVVELVLSDPKEIYLESGDVLDLADGVERVGLAWVGVVENLMDRHPEERRDIHRAAYGVVEKLVTAVRERGLAGATSTRSLRRSSPHTS